MVPREGIMPIADVLVVAGIVFGFLVFVTALMWADHQTKGLARKPSEPS